MIFTSRKWLVALFGHGRVLHVICTDSLQPFRATAKCGNKSAEVTAVCPHGAARAPCLIESYGPE